MGSFEGEIDIPISLKNKVILPTDNHATYMSDEEYEEKYRLSEKIIIK